jgi:glyoxylase-like metal-dependent hydrolase (beta-lactamase superfamily II)/predicted DCC family thiol-disulfide oxidoreductase YuxK
MNRDSAYHVIYDEQCEICQAGVSWLKTLDRRHRTVCHPIDPVTLARIHHALEVEACLRELHVVRPDTQIVSGWDAVATLARLFPLTWLIGAVGAVPGMRVVFRGLYRFVARNRYAFSKCRGGACHVDRPAATKKKARLEVFWSCYTIGMLLRLPLSLWVAVREGVSRVVRYLLTFRRRIELLDGRLKLLFLGGIPCDVVPIVFGEGFWTIIYDGVAVDPGSPRMRRSLRRHLRRLPPNTVRSIVATHHHEEHSGNLNWLAEITGAQLYVPPETAQLLTTNLRLPFARRFIIGEPPKLRPPFAVLGDRLSAVSRQLHVLPSPGHCHDHVVLYDPEEKLLIVADAFMGIYFSAPNPDVDSQKWIDTLERMLQLDVEILIEGHGLIHTERKDIPDIPGVVVRRNPKAELEEKLRYLRWIRSQIEAGFSEGLPIYAVEATCFPWGRSHAWEGFINDHLMRLLSLGHWSRTELIRSFVRPDNSNAVLPVVYQARIFAKKRRTEPTPPHSNS